MAELVDAVDSKSTAFGVWVQVPLRVMSENSKISKCSIQTMFAYFCAYLRLYI